MTILRITQAVQTAHYEPRPVPAYQAVAAAQQLLRDHPMVILSGINQEFTANRNNGKTISCLKLYELLWGYRIATAYLDMKSALKLANRANTSIDLEEFRYRAITELPAAKFYIFDEFHQAFPRHPDVKARDHWGIPVFRGEQYNSAMFKFWGKINTLIMQGSKFLLATALHPQRVEYQQFLYDTEIPAMTEYFRAPVMELPPAGA